jgi:hypothetical protein
MTMRWIEYDRINIRFGTYREHVAYLRQFDGRDDFRLEPEGPDHIVIRRRVARSQAA